MFFFFLQASLYISADDLRRGRATAGGGLQTATKKLADVSDSNLVNNSNGKKIRKKDKKRSNLTQWRVITDNSDKVQTKWGYQFYSLYLTKWELSLIKQAVFKKHNMKLGSVVVVVCMFYLGSLLDLILGAGANIPAVTFEADYSWGRTNVTIHTKWTAARESAVQSQLKLTVSEMLRKVQVSVAEEQLQYSWKTIQRKARHGSKKSWKPHFLFFPSGGSRRLYLSHATQEVPGKMRYNPPVKPLLCHRFHNLIK